MNKISRITIILLIFIICFLPFSCKESEYTIIKNVNIIPMTDNIILENYTVILKSDKIEEIGPAAKIKKPFRAKVIDGAGKYLIPGLCDAHVHFDEIWDAKLYVANGVTLVRNMWGTSDRIYFKKMISEKKIIGPEVYITTPLLDGEGTRHEGSTIIEGTKNLESMLKGLKSFGYQAIKVYDLLKKDVYDEIIRVSKELNMPVVGHVPFDVGLEHVLDSRQQSIEHLTGYRLIEDQDILDKLIKKTVANNVWNCPTLIILKNIWFINTIKENPPQEIQYVDPSLVSFWNAHYEGIDLSEAEKLFSEAKLILKKLFDQHALLVAGTDVHNPYVIAGFSLHDELLLLHEVGIPNYDVLKMATINVAQMLGYQDRLGTIEIGKDADLVLLDKNPLEDLSNTKLILSVFLKGKYLSKEDLQKLLDEVEKEFNY